MVFSTAIFLGDLIRISGENLDLKELDTALSAFNNHDVPWSMEDWVVATQIFFFPPLFGEIIQFD